MSRFRPGRQNVSRSLPPNIVEYSSLFLLLVAFTVSQALLQNVVRASNDVVSFYVDPRMFWTVVYATITMVLLAIGYVVYHRNYEIENRLDSVEQLRLALALYLLLLGSLYFVLGWGHPSSSGTMLLDSFIMAFVGMGSLSVLYTQLQGVEMKLQFPDRSVLPMVGIAILVPALVVLIFVVQPWTSEPSQWIFDGRYIRPVPRWFIVQNMLIAPIFSSFGMGLLFFGAIQETLRKFSSPPDAIIGTIVLIGVYVWVTPQMLVSAVSIFSFLVLLAGNAFVVLFTVISIRLWRRLDSAANSHGTAVATATVFGVSVVTLLFVGTHSVLGFTNGFAVSFALGYSVIVSIAAATYERTRSVWVPMIALGSFEIASSFVAYLQFLGGTSFL